VDCGKIISINHIRCITCSNKFRKGYKHTESAKEKVRLSKLGKLNPMFGKVYPRRIYRNHYIYLYRPNHPNATKQGYIAEHRIIMENCLGRILNKNEHVHHINGIKDDNDIINLIVLTSNEHRRLHMLGNTPFNKGKELSDKHKKSISKSMIGKKHTQQTKDKIREIKLKYWTLDKRKEQSIKYKGKGNPDYKTGKYVKNE